MNQYVITWDGFKLLDAYFLEHSDPVVKMMWINLKNKEFSSYNPQADREAVLDNLRKKYVEFLNHPCPELADKLTNINNIASHIGDLLTPLNQCLDAHNQRIRQSERDKVLVEAIIEFDKLSLEGWSAWKFKETLEKLKQKTDPVFISCNTPAHAFRLDFKNMHGKDGEQE